MPLPGLSIELGNGNTGSINASNDGISGMVLTGATVAGAGKVTLGQANQINALKGAEDIGITSAGTNSYAHQAIKEFYQTAEEGTALWLMLAASTISMEDMLDKTKNYAPILLDAAQGKVKLLTVSKKWVTGATITNGLDADVDKAMIKGQELAEYFKSKFMPFRFVVDGKDYSGTAADLKDYRSAAFRNGAVFIGATSASKNASVGFILGTLSALPVQRRLSRVKNGALAIASAYVTNATLTKSHYDSWNTIHDKGYIFFRTFEPAKSGYFFTSDTTATSLTDDYSELSIGRVIDKISEIAYKTYVEEIDDDILLEDDGTLSVAAVKSMQGSIETAVDLQMTANGEISSFEAIISPKQNIISTKKLAVSLKAIPVGYKESIDIKLELSNPAL